MAFEDEPIAITADSNKVCRTQSLMAALAALPFIPPCKLSLGLLRLFNEFRGQSSSIKKNEIAAEVHD